MEAIGFVKPNYPGERRVAILPEHVMQYRNTMPFDDIIIEEGFGAHLSIKDEEYHKLGCRILSREEVFKLSRVFSLKLIQPEDYKYLQEKQKIIGWMHPSGSGKKFYNTIVRDLKIKIFDIDSVYPRIYYPSGVFEDVNEIPRYFLWKNSYIAGMASVKLGVEYLNIKVTGSSRIAVLGSGSVSQGAFCYLSKLGAEPRMFYRKTLDLFYDKINEYEIIVNGIEIDSDDQHIIDYYHLSETSDDVLIIDAAADAGRSIEGTEYMSLDNPMGYVLGRKYILVNNAPTLMHEISSRVISGVVASVLLQKRIL